MKLTLGVLNLLILSLKLICPLQKGLQQFNNVKPVVSLTGSLALGTSFVLKLIILCQIITNGQIKQKENNICQTTPSFDPKWKYPGIFIMEGAFDCGGDISFILQCLKLRVHLKFNYIIKRNLKNTGKYQGS